MKAKWGWAGAAALLLLLSMGIGACSPDANSKADASDSEVTEETSTLDTTAVLRHGLEITDSAFKVLSGELKAAMGRGGVAAAVPFCQTMAYPLTDKVATAYEVQIRRTALKVRNPKNSAQGEETARLKRWEQTISEGGMPGPEWAQLDQGDIQFYRPIVVKELCTKCHGNKATAIGEEAYRLIQSLYPEDEATGYQAGDLRGMWVVTFKESIGN